MKKNKKLVVGIVLSLICLAIIPNINAEPDTTGIFDREFFMAFAIFPKVNNNSFFAIFHIWVMMGPSQRDGGGHLLKWITLEGNYYRTFRFRLSRVGFIFGIGKNLTLPIFGEE